MNRPTEIPLKPYMAALDKSQFVAYFPPELGPVASRTWDALEPWCKSKPPLIDPDASLYQTFGIVDDDLDELSSDVISDLAGRPPETMDAEDLPQIKTVADLVRFSYEVVQRIKL